MAGMTPAQKRWEDAHPEKRVEYRRRYYGKVSHGPNSGTHWTLKDLCRIVEEDRPCDTELAKELGRSIEAIQIARSKINNGVYNLHTDSAKNTGPRSGHRSKAPEIVPAATVCPRCFCTHPGDC